MLISSFPNQKYRQPRVLHDIAPVNIKNSTPEAFKIDLLKSALNPIYEHAAAHKVTPKHAIYAWWTLFLYRWTGESQFFHAFDGFNGIQNIFSISIDGSQKLQKCWAETVNQFHASPYEGNIEFDLQFQIQEKDNSLQFIFKMCPEFYTKNRLEFIARRFEEFTLAALKNLTVKTVDSMSIQTSQSENENNTVVFSEFKTSTHSDISCYLNQSTQDKPNHCALIYRDISLSYTDLKDKVDNYSIELHKKGVRRGKIVSICLERSADLIITILSILQLKATYLPLDPNTPPDRLKSILTDSQTKFLVTSKNKLNQFEMNDLSVIDVSLLHLESGENSEIREHLLALETTQSSDTAYIIYTSGSTGLPKGVMVSHGAVDALMHCMQKTPGLKADDIVLCANSFSFDIHIPDIHLVLFVGATLILVPPEDTLEGNKIGSIIDELEVTFMQCTPSHWQILLNSQWQGSKKLRAVAAGEPLSHGLAQEIKSKCRELWNGYGPTETTVYATFYHVKDLSLPLYIGTPLECIQMHILDESFNILPSGFIGEIYITGKTLCSGYINRPELNKNSFVEIPQLQKPNTIYYRTGDWGRKSMTGEIECLGRRDGQIKMRGLRIERGEIESVLMKHSGITSCNIQFLKSPSGEDHLVCYFVASNEISQNSIKYYLAEKLPQYMIPSYFIALESIPVTVNGKVATSKLPLPWNLKNLLPESDSQKSKDQNSNTLQTEVCALWKTFLGMNSDNQASHFFELGGTSLLAAKFTAELNSKFKLNIPVLRIFEYPKLGDFLNSLDNDSNKNKTLQIHTKQRKDFGKNIDTLFLNSKQESIAIVGMAGKFPGANSVEDLWEMLINEKEGVSYFSDIELEVAVSQNTNESYVPARGILEGADEFDIAFFGMSPREAEIMDPQQRLFMQIAWHALEDSGIIPCSYAGKIGVYAGTHTNTYYTELLKQNSDLIKSYGEFNSLLLNEKEYVATRTSYKLNLKGPSVAIQSACSTSLVAIHTAIQALRAGECDAAIAGASSCTVPIRSGHFYQNEGMLSADGHTRSFDEKGTGTVFSDGVAAIVLKTLTRAKADGDRIYALIEGTAINNDGCDKASFTAPSMQGQKNVILSALKDAGRNHHEIEYLETHGTGTPLGDPIEWEAIHSVFSENNNYTRMNPLYVGSIKSNIGHLTATAGIAGLIKTALSLYHEVRPASLHFQKLNPLCINSNSLIEVQKSQKHWPRTQTDRTSREVFSTQTESKKRLAGVSSFGVGGTNAHCILAEAPVQKINYNSEKNHLLVFSAKTENSLKSQIDSALATLKNIQLSQPEILIQKTEEFAQTLQMRRTRFDHKAFLIINSEKETTDAVQFKSAEFSNVNKLNMFNNQEIIFVIPGQGSQVMGMGSDFYRTSDIFKHAFDTCSSILLHQIDIDMRKVMTEPQNFSWENTSILQPYLFSYCYSLAKMWIHKGISPTAVIGHSLGEFVGAVISEIMELTDALLIIGARGRLMNACPAGAMLSVHMSESELSNICPPTLDIAAINGPKSTVVAGGITEIEIFEKILSNKSISSRRLKTSHAFHSRMMDSVLGEMNEILEKIKLSPPKLKIYSTVTGAILSDSEACSPNYWSNHLRQTVNFSAAIQKAFADQNKVFLEIGPSNVLAALTKQISKSLDLREIVSIATGSHQNMSENENYLNSVGQLYNCGIEIDWVRLHKNILPPSSSDPKYYFEKTKYWALSFTNKPTLQPEKMEIVTMQADRKSELIQEILKLIEDCTGQKWNEAECNQSFLGNGLDSLALTQLAVRIKGHFGIQIRFRQLMDEWNTVSLLADHLNLILPPEIVGKTEQTNVTSNLTQTQNYISSNLTVHSFEPLQVASGTEYSDIHAVVKEQLRIMAMQLAALGLGTADRQSRKEILQTTSQEVSKSAQNKILQPAEADKKPFGAIARINLDSDIQMTTQQKAAFDEFVNRYTTRTRLSKQMTEDNRKYLADPRVVTGFKPHLKEIIYQPIICKSKGSRLWDIDGHEYIDALCGFGMNLFGWSADFIQVALKEQLDLGMEIGPQTPLACEVSRLLSEFLDVERVAFCNTGSEAVMGCLRIARSLTGRNSVVTFAGSYHGIFDEVIQRPGADGRARPAASGIAPGTGDNAHILEYGSPAALEFISKNANSLAAVLVEAIQSRNPELQPREFLHEIRKITQKSGTALIFDEVITGFRLHPRGAQGYFDVKADLGAYGKVVGGGLPVGVIAGSSEWMDALDGGSWNFGDSSQPEVGVTYFAGTFVRHPLALAATKAVLIELKRSGPELQIQLNSRTVSFVKTINEVISKYSVPLKATSMGSLWRMSPTSHMNFGELLFCWMRSKGIHIWDGFPCFLTTAHSDGDLKAIVRALDESLAEMQEGDLLIGQNALNLQNSAINIASAPEPGARLGRDINGKPTWFKAENESGANYIKIMNEQN